MIGSYKGYTSKHFYSVPIEERDDVPPDTIYMLDDRYQQYSPAPAKPELTRRQRIYDILSGRINRRIKTMFKRLAIVIVTAAIIVGGSVLAVEHYQDYRALKNHSDTVAAAQTAKALDNERHAADIRQAALVQGFNQLYAECVKGLDAYNKLTPALKASTPVPACGAELLQ